MNDSKTVPEPVKVPDYQIAISCIMRVARGVFARIDGFGEDRSRLLIDWRTLRRTARLLSERGCLFLECPELHELREALRQAPPLDRDREHLLTLAFTERR